jgi:methane monooxygenase component D
MEISADTEPVEIFRNEKFEAYAQDLGFMWRWEIRSGGGLVQEGCSLTERAAHEAVGYVLAYFDRVAGKGPD